MAFINVCQAYVLVVQLRAVLATGASSGVEPKPHAISFGSAGVAGRAAAARVRGNSAFGERDGCEACRHGWASGAQGSIQSEVAAGSAPMMVVWPRT